MTDPASRASAGKIAKWLVERNRIDEAVELLCAWAANGANDVAGQQLLAEALRLNAGSPLTKMAFEKMEGIAGDHGALNAAIGKWDEAALQKFLAEMKPRGGARAQLGFNNNVKYKGRTYHAQTEDSGIDKPHVITHLFADGGRIIKSHKRSYAHELTRADLGPFVRELMKQQHMEMLLMLREGRFDLVIEGKAIGGIDTLTEPPNVEVKRVTKQKKTELGGSVPPPPPDARVPTPVVAPVAVAPAKKRYGQLVVMRSLSGGPDSYAIDGEENVVGSQGQITLPGEKFCHPTEAVVRFHDQKLWIDDLEGGNGAFLRIRSRVELEFGDEFIVGDQLFRVEKNPVADDEPGPGPTYFYSSPKWPSSFRVVQVFEGGATGACCVARGGMVLVGSAVGDIVIPTDPLVSEQHCMVEEQAGTLVLTDLSSRTGVFVRLRGEAELAQGDEVLFGRTRLMLDVSQAQ
ncbi:MAG: FHA domain-containing protein [Polyangiaceae bacterium]